jgi:hypothetical protein
LAVEQLSGDDWCGIVANLLTDRLILGQFAPQRNQARPKYQDFVRPGVGLPGILDDLQG